MKQEKNAYWRWGIIPVILILVFCTAVYFIMYGVFQIIGKVDIPPIIIPIILLTLFILSGLYAFVLTIRHFVKKRLEFNNLWSLAFSVGAYFSAISGIISLITGELPGTDNLFYDIVISIMCLIAWAVMYTVFAAIYIQIANLILRKRFKTMNKISIEVLDDDLPKPQRKLRRPPPSRRR